MLLQEIEGDGDGAVGDITTGLASEAVQVCML